MKSDIPINIKKLKKMKDNRVIIVNYFNKLER